MEFNSFIWSLYRDSEEGRAAISEELLHHFKCLERAPEKRFYAECDYFEIFDNEIVKNGIQGVKEIDLRGLIREHASEYKITNIQEAEKLFTKISDEGLLWFFESEGKQFEMVFGGGKDHVSWYSDIFSSIEALSAGLYDAHPEYFFPYLFARQFDRFEKICQFFDIQLPEVPGKLKKRERALYYIQINRILFDFRKCYGLSPKELIAFLYHFAPKNIEELINNARNLPPASRVWFAIGGVGGTGDFDYLDSADENSVSYWQGNLETRKGDIILIWCASPRSYLHSVWRALDEGFNDPFFYFYSLIRVGKPVKISPISFREFSEHPLLGSKPAVRSRFQGASATPFSLEDYEAICDMLQKEGFDISALPSPPATNDFKNAKQKNERDVEEMLLEPLLLKLGFTENDWIRQFPVRMGRGERNYPDYVLGANPTPGEESAFALIECKFDIESKKDIKEAFIQAKSYALRLQAAVLALAARRGLWIFHHRNDGFSIDNFLFNTWSELNHPDVFHRLSLIIGKRKVESSIMGIKHKRKQHKKNQTTP